MPPFSRKKGKGKKGKRNHSLFPERKRRRGKGEILPDRKEAFGALLGLLL